MSSDDINNKSTPQHRLVTSLKFSPTKRSALFIDSVLTPISIAYCGKEYVKDTSHFLTKLISNEQSLIAPGVQLFTLDVKALYPSINPTFVPIAIREALDTCSNFHKEKIDSVVEIVDFNVKNAIVHYRDEWFRTCKGISTGGSDLVCIANIFMKWVIIQFFNHTVHIQYKQLIICLDRFIDDLFGGWSGTERQFSQFIKAFNTFCSKFGIYFDKSQLGDTVNFLDVLISNATGTLVTDLYVKPTDAHRYFIIPVFILLTHLLEFPYLKCEEPF